MPWVRYSFTWWKDGLIAEDWGLVYVHPFPFVWVLYVGSVSRDKVRWLVHVFSDLLFFVVGFAYMERLKRNIVKVLKVVIWLVVFIVVDEVRCINWFINERLIFPIIKSFVLCWLWVLKNSSDLYGSRLHVHIILNAISKIIFSKLWCIDRR